MNRVFSRLATYLLKRSAKGRKLLQSYSLSPYLSQSGWFNSVNTQKPVDAQGNPLPWYTYASIAFLQERTNPSMAVFEYGSGNSTLWWSQRVAHVTSCEHDLSWSTHLGPLLPNNVVYQHIPLKRGGDYCQFIQNFSNTFDCIVIDGRDRVNCSYNCLKALKADGVIIWDNSDRTEYNDGYLFLLNHGFKRIDFWGMGPINPYSWCTSIFYRPNNCLQL